MGCLYRLRIVSPEGDFAQGGHGLQHRPRRWPRLGLDLNGLDGGGCDGLGPLGAVPPVDSGEEIEVWGGDRKGWLPREHAPSIDLLESFAEGGIPGLEGGDVQGWHLCLGRALKLHAAIHWYSEQEVLRVEFALPELDSVDTIEEESGFRGTAQEANLRAWVAETPLDRKSVV